MFIACEGVLDELDERSAGLLARMAARDVPVVLLAQERDLAPLEAELRRREVPYAGAYRAGEDASLRFPRPGLLLRAAAEHDLDLFSSWVVAADDAAIKAGGMAGCVGAVAVGGASDEVPGATIAVKRADDLADAPRVMIPPGGGCWHDDR